ncbi:MAG: alanyl-tRNA editing protein, partial [Nitratireductor sp.]|nr:alanyl-tRNA editing protein [Nitratireductor sp.]
HLLTVVCPYPITGASVGEEDSRVDFDLPDAGMSKEEVSERLMQLVRADHPVFTRWITDEELAANPTLVKSKNVRPPSGTGRIRLVCIGNDAAVDSQPCGGTHVASTAEVGDIHIGKIEKKGRENRRFRIRFGPLPAA